MYIVFYITKYTLNFLIQMLITDIIITYLRKQVKLILSLNFDYLAFINGVEYDLNKM